MRERVNDEKLTSVIECIVIRKTRTKSIHRSMIQIRGKKSRQLICFPTTSRVSTSILNTITS